ncbi:MAG TPA: PRC-barrel domain-containing protein [Candidatus Dormibacteraeota bacterium]|jgi:hypothetical protein|nr:PRC-barrel domain-containing protein [Candidatus Dormibacteraeota bacterium]
MPDFREWQGQEVRASDGERIGTLEEVYFDSETDTPVFLLVKSGMLGRRLSFAPVKGVRPGRTYLQLASSHDDVRRAPTLEAGTDINAEEEAKIYQHYGFDYAATDSGRRLVRR